ncbi:DNA alkylation repair protein [Candidatus Saccharibacteria bacterium]|nr:MAG: DNA alkylation repair protein [Candidatus Saccharibacteria bacterium]
MIAADVVSSLQDYASGADAVNLQWFFKTGPGEYGEGDQFIGVRVPNIRKVCKKFRNLPLKEVQQLLESPVHEHRMAGVIILTLQYPKADDKQAIYELYLAELGNGHINNWDLVDVSCRHIVGEHLRENRSKLYELAKSESLWERRASIISTFAYIAKGDASTSLALAELLLGDKHDLMHKAVGWTLREVGKRCDEQLLRTFLSRHAPTMPRTTLRYAIEHLPEDERKGYLNMKQVKED